MNRDILRVFEQYAPALSGGEVIDGEDCIIASDWEIPDTNPQMIAMLKAVGEANKIDTLVVAGDFLATDQESLTHWTNTYAEDQTPAFENVLKLGIRTLDELHPTFPNVRILRGNHDDRVAKATKGQVHLGIFLELAGYTYSQYDHLYLNTSRGFVKVIHPRQYSQNPLTLAQKFYNVTEYNGQKCHIVIAHTHQAAIGRSSDKLRDLVGLGCLRDPARTKYARRNSATFPGWDQGFLMIKNGFLHPFVLGQTDPSTLGVRPA